MFYKLKIPIASNKKIPSWKKKQTVQSICAERNNLQSNCPRNDGQAQNSCCLEQEFSITKKNLQCKLCVANQTIRNPIVQEYVDKLKIPTASSNHFQSPN